MTITISDIHRKWATIAYEAAVNEGAKDADVDSYLERILQPRLDAFAAEVCASWKPPEDPAVVERKALVAEKLKDIPEEKLAAIEAELAKEDSEVVKP